MTFLVKVELTPGGTLFRAQGAGMPRPFLRFRAHHHRLVQDERALQLAHLQDGLERAPSGTLCGECLREGRELR